MNAITPIAAAPAISIFDFHGPPIRVANVGGGRPRFVAADVCKALSLSNVTVALRNFEDRDRAKLNLGHPQGEVSALTESGLYTLMMRSRSALIKDTPAYKFRVWVTDQVLPAIRQTGFYVPSPAPVVLPEILRDPATILALIEHQARETLAARAEAEAERLAHSETHAALEDEARLRRIESARAKSNGRALVVVSEQVKELTPLAEGYR